MIQTESDWFLAEESYLVSERENVKNLSGVQQMNIWILFQDSCKSKEKENLSFSRMIHIAGIY